MTDSRTYLGRPLDSGRMRDRTLAFGLVLAHGNGVVAGVSKACEDPEYDAEVALEAGLDDPLD